MVLYFVKIGTKDAGGRWRYHAAVVPDLKKAWEFTKLAITDIEDDTGQRFVPYDQISYKVEVVNE